MEGKNPKEIIWPRSPPVTCQYPEGFRWKPDASKTLRKS